MSRNISAITISSINQAVQEELWLILLEIDHVNLSSPIYVAGNVENIIFGGHTYVGYDFKIALPVDDADSPPVMSITIENIDRAIVEAIRIINTPAAVTVTFIRYDPGGNHVVELAFPPFKGRSASYEAKNVTMDITLESFLAEPFPGGTFSPADFPSAF